MEEAAREGIVDQVMETFGDLEKKEPAAKVESEKKEESPLEEFSNREELDKKEAPQKEAEAHKDESIDTLKDKIQDYLNQISRLQEEFASFKKKGEEDSWKEEKAPEPEKPKKEEPKKEEKTAKHEKTKEESAESLKEKVQDYKNQIVRLQADFSNFRKRAEKEKVDAIRFGREVILEQMIGLNDVMENALRHAQTATDVDSLKKGFEMVIQEFARFLKSEGAEPLKTVGQNFDPHLHEAVEQVETEDEKENNIILEEFQKGYELDGRLLRPAKVKVAKLKEEK